MTRQTNDIHTGQTAPPEADKPHSTAGFGRLLRRALFGTDATDLDKTVLRQRLGSRLCGVFKGLLFGVLAYFLGSTPLLWGAAPLGLALLCAGSTYTWVIWGGLMLSAFLHPVTLSSLAWVCLYTLCVLLRLAVLLFVDPPDLPGLERQPGFAGAVRFAARCLDTSLRSALRNMGLRRAPHTPEGGDAEPESYYAGAEWLRRVPSDVNDPPPADRTHRPAGDSGKQRRTSATTHVPPGGTAPEVGIHLFCEHPLMRALVGAVTGLTAGVIGAVTGGFHVYDLAGALLMLLSVPAAVLLLSPAFSPVGQSLLFDAHPHVVLREHRLRSTAAQGRGLLWSGVGALSLCLAAVYTVSPHAFMIGTPYLTIMPATLLGLLLTLSAASRLGLLPGLLTALVSGLGAGAAYLPVFLLTAVVYAFLHILSHRAGVIGGCCAGAVWCAACGSTLLTITQLPTVLLAAPIRLLIETVRDKLPGAREIGTVMQDDFAQAESERVMLDAQRTRLLALSAAFSDMSHELSGMSDDLKKPRAAELRGVCDEVFRDKCRDCIRRSSCPGWSDSRDSSLVDDTKERLTSMLSRRGHVSASSLAPQYREYCPHMGELIEDINARTAQLTAALIKGDKTQVLASDYAHMASILTDVLREEDEDEPSLKANRAAADKIYEYLTSLDCAVQGVVVCGRQSRRIVVRGSGMEALRGRTDEIRRTFEDICGVRLSEPDFEEDGTYTVMTLTSRPQMQPVYAGSTVPSGFRADADGTLPPPLTGEGDYAPPPVCGDHIAAFTNDNACFYALISDGMGSGQDASDASGLAVQFLERMLSAGNRAEVSLRMLNTLLLAKNEGGGDECSATVDLMELDTVGGQATFAKNGAAPTYVVRGGTVYKLRSRSLPLGILRDSAPELLHLRMHPGDVVVMVSDGVTLGNDECPWLIDLLSTPLPDSMDSLRLDILKRAIASGSPDDLSAVAIRVEDEDTP